jgi:Fe-S oxidoreductase
MKETTEKKDPNAYKVPQSVKEEWLKKYKVANPTSVPPGTDRLYYPKDEWLYKYYYDIRKISSHCQRCNSCKYIDSFELKNSRFARVCPSAAYYLFDGYSCQGRMDLCKAMLDNKITPENSPKFLDVWYKCNTCGGCDASDKRVRDSECLRVMLDIRAQLVEEGQLVPEHMMIIDCLRKEDNTMMGKKADRGKWAEGLDVKDLTKEKAEVVFHAGCLIDYDEELWKIARTSIKLLKKAGVDVGIFGKDETCCGSRMWDLGYRGEFTKYAENNIEAWKNAGVKTVVTACADGYWGMKRLYPDLGSQFEVLHIVEYLDRLIKEGKIKFSKTIPLTVTYHDPCHLGRRTDEYYPGKAISGVYDEPRNILKAIPGVEFVEMYRIKEYAWCCGSGGGVREAYPDFSAWTAGERIEEAKAVGAEAIVSACPHCQRNFVDSVNEKGGKTKVLDIVELVDQAI